MTIEMVCTLMGLLMGFVCGGFLGYAIGFDRGHQYCKKVWRIAPYEHCKTCGLIATAPCHDYFKGATFTHRFKDHTE